MTNDGPNTFFSKLWATSYYEKLIVNIRPCIYLFFFITSIYLIEDYPAHKALWGFPHIIMLHVIMI